MIKYTEEKTNNKLKVMTKDKRAKRASALKQFHKEVGKNTRVNAKRAVQSLEYAKHTRVK